MGQLLSQKAYHLLAVLNFCLMVSNELLLSPSCFIISLISPEVCLFESKENGFRKQSPWFISHLKNLLSLLYTSTFQTKNIKRGLIQRNLWMNKTWRLHSASLLKKKKEEILFSTKVRWDRYLLHSGRRVRGAASWTVSVQGSWKCMAFDQYLPSLIPA